MSTLAQNPVDLIPAEEVVLKRAESPAAKRQRISIGVLVGVVAVAMFCLLPQTHGTARMALSNAFDAVQLPTIPLPAFATVLICALVLTLCAAAYLSGRVNRRTLTWVGVLAGAALLIGFLAWAAAGKDLPFLLSDQMAGTIALSTPLVLGALGGIMCERAGVVNVAIEGQMLTGAFTAAFVGTLTHSVTWAFVAGAVAGVLMGALLAVFAIKYLVDQVVLGVVINLFATGLTGFLFDTVMKTDAAHFNNPPALERIPIPLLDKIPFFGSVLFTQTALVYLAIVAVVVVWVILFRTRWGLRIRSVGEHPLAADTVGIHVHRVQWSAVLFGGLLAGVAGASFGAFNDGITVGNGFIALACVIMGRWHPVWAAMVALFFGFTTQMSTALGPLGTPIPSNALKMLPYVITVIAVAGLVGRVRGPKHDGVPYVKQES